MLPIPWMSEAPFRMSFLVLSALVHYLSTFKSHYVVVSSVRALYLLLAGMYSPSEACAGASSVDSECGLSRVNPLQHDGVNGT